MTESYQKIQKQIEALQRQADKLRQKEIEGVVARIKVAIAHYGLTSEQLGLGRSSKAPRAKAGARVKASSGYADGNGNTWSGRGPRPRWLREAIEAGQSIESFRLQSPGASAPRAPAAAEVAQAANARSAAGPRRRSRKKAASQVRYRDQAGNSWSGRGPKPRWFKEALAGGQSLESLAA